MQRRGTWMQGTWSLHTHAHTHTHALHHPCAQATACRILARGLALAAHAHTRCVTWALAQYNRFVDHMWICGGSTPVGETASVWSWDGKVAVRANKGKMLRCGILARPAVNLSKRAAECARTPRRMPDTTAPARAGRLNSISIQTSRTMSAMRVRARCAHARTHAQARTSARVHMHVHSVVHVSQLAW